MYDFYEELLKEKGVSTSDVSKATGISQSVFSNWKKRRGGISAKFAAKIAEYFEITVTELIYGRRFDKETKEIVAKMAEMAGAIEIPRGNIEADKVREAYINAPESIKDAICKLLDIKRALPSSKEA